VAFSGVARLPAIALPVTTAVLLTLYQGFFTLLAVAFGFAAYRKHT
jgi:hypothetical protein